VGVSDALEMEGRGVCYPEGVTVHQVTAVVKKYLEDRPQDRHLGAEWLVAHAVREAFPCGQ
jgi:hypothetical protein